MSACLAYLWNSIYGMRFSSPWTSLMCSTLQCIHVNISALPIVQQISTTWRFEKNMISYFLMVFIRTNHVAEYSDNTIPIVDDMILHKTCMLNSTTINFTVKEDYTLYEWLGILGNDTIPIWIHRRYFLFPGSIHILTPLVLLRVTVERLCMYICIYIYIWLI